MPAASLGEIEGFVDAPVDGEVGVVPEDAAVAGLVPEGGAFVEHFGVVAEDAEAVGEAGGDPEHVAVLGGELGAGPLAEGGGAAADVDGDVEDGAAGAADELSLRLLELVVQAADDASARVRMVVLGERLGEAVLAERRRVEVSMNQPRSSPKTRRLEDQHAGEGRLGDVFKRRG